MNTAAKPAIISIAVLLLATLCARAFLTDTNNGALPALGPPFDSVTNARMGSLYFAPVILAKKYPDPSQPLQPGVYQTHPYAIILIVPEKSLDARCVVPASAAAAPMPIVKPQLRAEPLPASR